MTILFLTANRAIALSSENEKQKTSDKTVIMNFNWEQENKIRQNSNSTYAGANLCSRWIHFSDKEFFKLKELDGKKVKITTRHSVIEGLDSKKQRGVDITLMQGTQNDINCDCVLTVKLNE